MKIWGDDLLQEGGSTELSQSNFPIWGEIVNLGTAKTAKHEGERTSTVRRAEG